MILADAGVYGNNKDHFVVTFAEQGGIQEFHRWGCSQDEAVEDARRGFQWAYGFWPGEPVSVRPCSGCGNR